MNRLVIFAMLLTAPMVSVIAQANDAPSALTGTVVVVNQASDTVTLVDLASLEDIAPVISEHDWDIIRHNGHMTSDGERYVFSIPGTSGSQPVMRSITQDGRMSVRSLPKPHDHNSR